MNNNRLRNYGLWIAIAALIGLICQNFGLFQYWGLTNDTYNQLVQAILGVLVLAGIVNNPTTEGKGFADDPIPISSKVINGSGITTTTAKVDTTIKDEATTPIQPNAPTDTTSSPQNTQN